MAFAVPLLTTALSTTAGKVAAGAVGGALGASLMGRRSAPAAAAPPPAPAPVVAPPTPVPPPPPAPVVAPQPAPVAAPAPTPASRPAPTEGAAAPAIPVSTGIGSTAASGGQAETAAIMAEAAGPAEEEAARTASRGRRSTIATGPQGILGTSGARAARSLVGGGGLIR